MEIVNKKPITVVGIPVKAKWDELWRIMPEVWSQFLARHREIKYKRRAPFIDVSLEKEGNEYHQLICLEVSRVRQVPEGMRAIEIPEQKYIHYKHRGPVTGIAESFAKIYHWADGQGRTVSEFKIDVGYTAKGVELEHDLYVGMHPVQPWHEVEVG